MKVNRCFFIGRADTTEDIFPGLSIAIEQQIEQHDVTEFYVGNNGHFDVLVFRALRAAKRRYPYIHCYLVLVYHSGDVQSDPPAGMDGIYYPLMESVPPRFAIPRTNRAMIDQCNVLIATAGHPGRLREVLLYAQRREQRGLIRIVNLPDTKNEGTP